MSEGNTIMSKHIARRIRPVLWAAGLLLVSSGVAAQTTPAGRLLASNCFQCHGTNGKNGPWDSLAGKSAAEIVKEMKEMRAKTGSGDEAIMAAHARSYSDAQIALIADYFSKVR